MVSLCEWVFRRLGVLEKCDCGHWDCGLYGNKKGKLNIFSLIFFIDYFFMLNKIN